MKTENGKQIGSKQFVQRISEGFKKGWRDARWSFYFGLYLLVPSFIGTLIELLFYGPSLDAPHTITWIFLIPGTLWSLTKATKKTGNLNGMLIEDIIRYYEEWKRKIEKCLTNYRNSKP